MGYMPGPSNGESANENEPMLQGNTHDPEAVDPNLSNGESANENQPMLQNNPNGAEAVDPPQVNMHGLENRRPIILHPFAGWGLCSICVVMAIIVIVLYQICKSRNGFPIDNGQTFRDDVVRFLWSSGPALPMTVVTGLILAPFAFNMWLHAPYTGLERGPAPGDTTVFMNWFTKGPFKRIYLACRHGKPGLATLAIATLLSGFLPIVASGLLGQRTIIVRVHTDIS